MSSIPGHGIHRHGHSLPPKEVFLSEEALNGSKLAINYADGYTDNMDNMAIPSDLTFSNLTYADSPLEEHGATSYHPPIPPLIKADGINKGNVNMLLGSLTDLPFPTTFKSLLGSAMALWAVLAPDATTIGQHGLDTAIDGFMDFISPSHPPPTAVSPAPLPMEIPPTPYFSDPMLPSPLPHDEDAIMASGDSSDMPSSCIHTPTPHPLEKGKMQAWELSKVPGDLMPTSVAPSALPAPSTAPINLVSPTVIVEVMGKKTGKKQASFAKVTTKVKTAPGP